MCQLRSPINTLEKSRDHTVCLKLKGRRNASDVVISTVRGCAAPLLWKLRHAPALGASPGFSPGLLTLEMLAARTSIPRFFGG